MEMIYLEDTSYNRLPMLSCSTEEEWDIVVRVVKDIVITNDIKSLFGTPLHPFRHSEKHGGLPIDESIYHSLINVLSAFEIQMIPEWDSNYDTWFQHLDKHGIKYYKGE